MIPNKEEETTKKVLHIKSPLLHSTIISKEFKDHDINIYLKLDSVQPSGSFKIRGIGKLCEKVVRENGVKHFINSSGGNAGISTAYAGKALGIKTTIVVPKTIPQETINKMTNYGAIVKVHGNIWDEADTLAREIATEEGGMEGYIHPFDNPMLWEGHSTIIEEIYEDHMTQGVPKPDLIVCSVGGGGLFLGVSEGLIKVGWGDVPILAVETHGSHSFYQCFKENSHIKLEASEVTSIAKTLATRSVAKAAWEQTKKHKVFPVLVSDKEAVDACLKFVDQERVLVEPSCGASLAAVYKQVPEILNYKNVYVIVCGGNTTSISHLTKLSQSLDSN